MSTDKFTIALAQRKEEAVHRYLAKNCNILITTFFPSGTALCLSKFHFGSTFISDFLLVGLWSTITDIVLVELEPPHVRPFNRNGNFSRRLNGAIQQVTEWSAWIRENRRFFHDSILEKAAQVNPSCVSSLKHRIRHDMLRSKIVIGRRSMMSETDDARRASLYLDSGGRIEIVPYDRLLDTSRRSGSNANTHNA